MRYFRIGLSCPKPQKRQWRTKATLMTRHPNLTPVHLIPYSETHTNEPSELLANASAIALFFSHCPPIYPPKQLAGMIDSLQEVCVLAMKYNSESIRVAAQDIYCDLISILQNNCEIPSERVYYAIPDRRLDRWAYQVTH